MDSLLRLLKANFLPARILIQLEALWKGKNQLNQGRNLSGNIECLEKMLWSHFVQLDDLFYCSNSIGNLFGQRHEGFSITQESCHIKGTELFEGSSWLFQELFIFLPISSGSSYPRFSSYFQGNNLIFLFPC